MVIIVNGEEMTFRHFLSLGDFLKSKDIKPESVVVELNKKIIKTEHYDQTQLKDKDVLEILRFVGGG
ncbi:ThiS, thiamine-biosynthesis [Candidatus Magnetomorum sp. HK-1]|nr:ThiS, thiamine-biosynthesis [Candidatus Magnetomorum sp. HK-1]